MANRVVQYLITTIYECSKDVATGKVTYLDKQTNDEIPVLEQHLWRTTTPMSANEIVKAQSDIVAEKASGLTKEPVKYLYAYPLLEHEEGSLDKQYQFTVIEGIMIEQRKHDVNEPVVVLEGQDRTKVIEDWLRPYEVAVPFLFLLPEVDNLMYEIKIAHVPMGAVTEWDSSKHETDPHLNGDEGPTIPQDPLGPYISEEDAKKMMEEALQKKAAEEATKAQ